MSPSVAAVCVTLSSAVDEHCPPHDKYSPVPPYYHSRHGMSKPSATKYTARINTVRHSVRPAAVCETLSFNPLEIKTVR